LYKIGYKVSFKTSLNSSLLNCDILCVLSSCFRYNYNDKGYISKLEKIVNQAKQSIFFDISDSAGILYETAFGMFDEYYKKQIYKDKKIYNDSEMKDPRLHVNNYIFDSDNNEKRSIVRNYSHMNPDDINKIKVSWNVGIGDYRTFISGHNVLNKHILSLQTKLLGKSISIPKYKFRYNDLPIGKRVFDIIACFNLYDDQRNKEISLHRKQTLSMIKVLKDQYSIIKGFFPKHEYCRYLQNSKIGISPFGWGEITWKDFEIFLNGLILLKPKMDHLSTWPNYFIENKTYIPYDWDAIDLKKTIERILDDISSFEEIPAQGQENYKRYNVISNPEPFIQKFKEIFH